MGHFLVPHSSQIQFGAKFSPSHNVPCHHHPISYFSPSFRIAALSQISYPFDSKHTYLKRTKSVRLMDKGDEKDHNSQEFQQVFFY